ncbi:MAG: alginate lyase family protein [Verrucomicrobiota bacterium]
MKDLHQLDDIPIDHERVLKQAEEALVTTPESITEAVAPMSEGGLHDYFSMGDYWWPNPDTADGLPYIRKDGYFNPDSFSEHRLIVRRLRTRVAQLAAGYVLSGKEDYAAHAAKLLHVFFIDPSTRMNSHLCYAQAIPGRCSGRGIGIIDTLHLVEVPVATEAMRHASSFPESVYTGLKEWFSEYLQWLLTHENSRQEMNHPNNHGVCWHVQASVFAWFTWDRETQEFCRRQYKNFLLPEQMAADGSFPKELQRTKPYAYSIFIVDNLCTLCHVLSTSEDNLWGFTLPDGRSIGKALEFLYPYLEDKSKWPYPPDVEAFEGWPVAMAGFLFAGLGLHRPEYYRLWQRLDSDPQNMEIRRNMAICEPLLWLLPETFG